jgi:hypothetical protein
MERIRYQTRGVTSRLRRGLSGALVWFLRLATETIALSDRAFVAFPDRRLVVLTMAGARTTSSVLMCAPLHKPVQDCVVDARILLRGRVIQCILRRAKILDELS